LVAIYAASDLAFNQEKCVLAILWLDFLVHRITAVSVTPLRDNVQTDQQKDRER
jgi:hypothetical protein